MNQRLCGNKPRHCLFVTQRAVVAQKHAVERDIDEICFRKPKCAGRNVQERHVAQRKRVELRAVVSIDIAKQCYGALAIRVGRGVATKIEINILQNQLCDVLFAEHKESGVQ